MKFFNRLGVSLIQHFKGILSLFYTAVTEMLVVLVVLLFYVHGKHLRSCRDGQLT